MVRPPGFEPGSLAWKARVLVQARLRPLSVSWEWGWIKVFWLGFLVFALLRGVLRF